MSKNSGHRYNNLSDIPPHLLKRKTANGRTVLEEYNETARQQLENLEKRESRKIIQKEFIPVCRNEEDLLEDAIQENYFNWVYDEANALLMPELTIIHSIPNSARRSKIHGHKMNLTGLRAGIPDVHIPFARNGFQSLYIEFKRVVKFNSKNNGCSDNQLIMIERLKHFGHKVVVLCRASEAIKLTKDYLGY